MKRRRRQKVGILGGTFNPIHLGHLLIAQDALEQARLDRVKFVPALLPPHKPLAGDVTPRQRLAMVRAAVRGDDRFEVDDLEMRRGGPSFSVETVAELRRREPGTDFYFIIGSDSLPELPQWKESDRLVTLCRFVVVERPAAPSAAATPLPVGLRATLVRGHACEIASRDIRARCRARKSIRYLVPDAVLRYIRRHKLYL